MEIDIAARLDSANNDRLTALKAVTNFGMPMEEFDSEGKWARYLQFWYASLTSNER